MSPPLEGDEEALIQSAIDIKQRSFSREQEGLQRLKRSREELETSSTGLEEEVGEELLGMDGGEMWEKEVVASSVERAEGGWGVNGLESPESVDLEELDDLFGGGSQW